VRGSYGLALGGIVFFSVSSLTAQSDDPYVSYQWHLGTIQAETAWKSTTDCTDIKIGVIDTGIDLTHEDLVENIDGIGYNFVSESKAGSDDNGHGTFAAGLIGAEGNNKKGVSGLCWRANLIPLKVLDSKGSGFLSDAADALVYAADSGINITNNSYGGPPNGGQIWPSFIVEALDYAGSQGVINVFAAGNSNFNMDSLITSSRVTMVRTRVRNRWVTSRVVTPGSRPSVPASVILVGATTNQDERASFSNYGSQVVDFGAPGQDIVSTTLKSSYGSASGTSFSAPIVTGALALLWSRHQDWSAEKVKAGLLSLASNPSFSSTRDIQVVSYTVSRQRVRGRMVNVRTPVYSTRTIVETRTPLQGLFSNRSGARLDLSNFQ